MILLEPIPAVPVDLEKDGELEVIDGQGRLLRHIPAEDGTRSKKLSAEHIPRVLIKCFLAAEDKRFYSHPGYDLLAYARALVKNLKAGRVVSGASTITQQLVRMAYPRPRTIKSKFLEMLSAVKLEHLLSKEDILGLYLNNVPMGYNIRGVALACERYFGHHISRISLSEAALLASLPQSPARIFYDRDGLELRRKEVLRRMMTLGFLEYSDFHDALRNAPVLCRPKHPFEATHAVEMALKQWGNRGEGPVKTTLDLDLQNYALSVIRSRRNWLQARACSQAALIVLDNESAAIKVLIGSMGVEVSPDGWNNACTAHRSAGSTLKPFAYGLALERGWTASSMLRDTLRSYSTPSSDYRPLNFSRVEHGPVSMREALGASLNLPAVNLLKNLGISPFFEKLQELGLKALVPLADHYGLGLVLGNLEVRLLDLAAAYSCLARGGVYIPPHLLAKERGKAKGRRVFSSQAAYIVSDILADSSARVLAFGTPWYLDFPWPVALKTGTSTSYRDTWLVAYTRSHTVGVWAGNFNGSPTAKLTGAEACGPIVHDLLEHLYSEKAPKDFIEPEGLVEKMVCSTSGSLPGEACRHRVLELFIASSPPSPRCSIHSERDPELVYLPSQYGPWESRRLSQGLLGRFRLQGQEDVPRIQSLSLHSPDRGSSARDSYKGYVSIAGKEPPVSPWPEGPCRIEITSPLSVDRYVIGSDPSRSSQLIPLRVELSRPVSRVTWYVDGVVYERRKAPYECYWPLERGQHRISASCPDGTADSVTISVE